jgi:transposase
LVSELTPSGPQSWRYFNRLFHWRKLVAASEYRALQNYVRELQRQLGRKIPEDEIFKDALAVAAGTEKPL